MSKSREIDRLDGLFRAVTDKSQSFLLTCSEAKAKAIANPREGTEHYRRLALEALCSSPNHMVDSVSCRDHFATARDALQAGTLDDAIDALRVLRNTFLQDILKPAVREYLLSETQRTDGIEKLYESQLKLDRLLEAAQFIRKLR